MRKILILITVLVMALSAMPVYAEQYNACIEHGHSIDNICGLSGNSVNQVNRTCKKCHTRTVIVYCVQSGFPIYSTTCGVLSHSQPCTITNRIASIANAHCTYCGSYHYDAGEFKVWDFEGHVESCYHTSTNTTYYTCPYGPRE